LIRCNDYIAKQVKIVFIWPGTEHSKLLRMAGFIVT